MVSPRVPVSIAEKSQKAYEVRSFEPRIPH